MLFAERHARRAFGADSHSRVTFAVPLLNS
ncbi:MAG: hypothetical protein QOK09_1454 [Mycobacterium sp.]|jgi:hypothetical protein|nr:hypothetical protein [Mycobacterium sp.]